MPETGYDNPTLQALVDCKLNSSEGETSSLIVVFVVVFVVFLLLLAICIIVTIIKVARSNDPNSEN